MRNKNYILSLMVIFLVLISCQEKPTSVQIVNLRCENRIDPLGIDQINPQLSWNLESPLRNIKQTAYQILVSDNKENLEKDEGDLWDTKKIHSDRSIQQPYKGKKLASGAIVYWKVRVWNEKGLVSDWSEIARWEMGLLHLKDWEGNWISDGKPEIIKIEDYYKEDPAPYFRQVFKNTKKINKARLYISGLGYYTATINGINVGDHVLDPGWTNYNERILYSTFDVTNLIAAGNNCIGVALGNGWFNPLPMLMFGGFNLREALPVGRPKFIAQLNIEYVDGSKESIISSEAWKTHEGPILRNNIFLGEIYDARKEIKDWNLSEYIADNWSTAKIVTKKTGILQAQNQPPIKIRERIQPIKITEPLPDVYIFDMGQNFSGWVQLNVKEKAGTTIKLRYGELIYPDGTLNAMTSVAGQVKGRKKDNTLKGGPFSPEIAWQSDTYISKGGGIEQYVPKFTFHAFRYVEVTGLSKKPSLEMLEGLKLSSNINKVGTFECSNELYNKIQEITERTFLNNVFSVQSDCPHRERFGYGGDLAVTTDAFIYNFDMSNFYAKVVRDFQDAALSDGRLTDTAPFVGIDYCGIGWAFAHPLTLLELYQYYGNKALIKEQYAVAKRWFDGFINNNDLIITQGLSDHEGLDPIPTEEMVTPLYYQSAIVMSKLAKILNQSDDVQKYDNLSVNIKKAYLEKFQKDTSGKYAPYTQGSQAFALYTGIGEMTNKKAAINELVHLIKDKNNGHLSSGIFGTKYTLEVLSENGLAQTAAIMVDKKTFPSWGYMLENDATTLWEHWKFSDNTYSHNHPMFGSVSEWFYKWVGGIQADPQAVGFDKIIIRPQIISTVNWANTSYNSVQGKIVSNWQRDGNVFKLQITIPINSNALVYLPSDGETAIKEGGININERNDIEFVKNENGCQIYSIGSGSYTFESKISLK